MEDKNTNVRVITAESNSFVLDTCCCCIPLRTGCLILGYLQLVGHIVGALFSVLGIAGGTVLLEQGELKPEQEYVIKIVVAFCVITLVFIVISLPFTIFLLVGLHKEKRNYVKVYLVFAVVMLVLNVILLIAKFSGGYAAGKEAPSAVISTLLSIYYLLVLRSQYIKMGIAQNMPTQHYRDGLLMQKPNENETPTRPLEQAKFVFNMCCFCIPLKTGSLILAYLFLVGNVVSGLLTILAIVSFAKFLSLNISEGKSTIVIIMLMIHTASLVLDLVAISFNILLLVGLHKERRNYVKMFLIFQVVNIILNVLKHIFFLSHTSYSQAWSIMQVIFLVMALASDVLNIYYLLVMRSQHVKMGEANIQLPGQAYRDGRVEIMPLNL